MRDLKEANPLPRSSLVFYSAPPDRKSYFVGCSDRGRDREREKQRQGQRQRDMETERDRNRVIKGDRGARGRTCCRYT